MTSEICDLTAVDQRALLEASEVSAREMLRAHLERIDAVNPVVNAVVAMDRERAEATAAAIDQQRAAGVALGPLAGLVTAHKDLTDTADFITTYGSPLYADHRPEADSLLVTRVKAAGAVAVGKTNTPELGAGSHTFNPVYGVTRNPWDTNRSAGGSSGGAAAALSSGMVSVADGSDMGGSLRNPAAWNNVVGFRASAGLVPSIAPGMDRATFGVEGAMGRTVADLRLLLSVIGAPETRDPLNRGVVIAPERAESKLSSMPRVAFSPSLGGLPVEAPVADVVARFVGDVAALGWEIVEAEPDLTGADECFAAIRSFLFANGKFGSLDERLSETKSTVQEEFARGRAMTGADVAAAHRELGRLWRSSVDFFADVDLLIAPVTQMSPFPVDTEYPMEVNGVACERYIDWMRSCCRVTSLGVPALSLPAGFDREGMPVGVQLIGRHHGDLELLAIADELERAIPVEHRRPAAVPRFS